MKVLLLLFLVGFAAAASLHQQVEEASEDAYHQLMLELENAEEGTNDDIKERLRKTFDEIVDKIKDSIDKGKELKEDYLKKLEEIREKMKELKVTLGDKAKEMLEKLKGRIKDYWKKIFGKDGEETSEAEIQMADFNIKEMFQKLRDTLLAKIDKEKLKAKIEEIFGKGNVLAEDLLKLLNEKGDSYKKKLLDLVDRYLKKKEEKRALNEMFEFAEEGTNDDIKERLRKTFDEILEKIKDSIDQGKDLKEEYLKKLKEIRDKMKDLKVDIGQKAKELIKKFKDSVKGYWKKILEKLGDGKDTSETEIQMADFNMKDLFQKLKKALLSTIDKEKLKEKIEEIFGKGNAMADDLLKLLNEKGGSYKKKLLDLIDRYLKKQEEKRALSEMLEFAEEDDTKTEVGKSLRKTLDEILQKIKDAAANGKVVGDDLVQKFKEIRQKLKDMKLDIGEKAKELLKKVKERFNNFWKEILDKLNDKETQEAEIQSVDVKDMFKKLKQILLGKIDKEKLKAKIEEMFGKGTEMADGLLKILNEKGDKIKQKLLDLIDRYLKPNEEKRSVKDMWEKVKDYFKNLQIDLKEKYMKFGEWVKTVADKALNKSKDKIDNIRSIAKEFVEHTKGVSKEVAVEALEFLKPYKEDLGALWDQVKVAVKEIVQRKED